jgi:hypothetical protein
MVKEPKVLQEELDAIRAEMVNRHCSGRRRRKITKPRGIAAEA